MEPPAADLLTRPIEDAADLLADPATAEDGVWVLLSGLGLGVYSGDGRQLLAGSETTADDLWLLDLGVPGLARMAEGQPRTFTALHAALAADGLELTAEELQAFYLAALSAHPDLPMSRALSAFHLDLDVEVDAVELSPLTMWLLLLSLLPPNPPGSAPAATGASPVLLASPTLIPTGLLLTSSGDCDGISGSGATSGWSLAGDVGSEAWGSASDATLDELVPRIGGRSGKVLTVLSRWLSRFAKALEALTVALALDSITTDLRVDRAEVRRLQDREQAGSQAVTLTATVTSRRVPPVRCGPLTGMELPGGPLEAARVSYELDGFLRRHGHLRYPGGGAWQMTDAAGQSRVRYETIHDDPPDAHRRSPSQNGTGTVTATFDSLLNALGETFNLFATVELVAGAFGAFDQRTVIGVSWHEQAPARALDVVETAAGDLLQVDLVACDGPRGTWRGTINHMDFFDVPWAAEVTFTFPDQTSDAAVSWSPGQGQALLDDGLPLFDAEFRYDWDHVVVYDDQVDPPRLRFWGAVTAEIVGRSQSSLDASFDVPVRFSEDPRCGS